jgi:SsrA-binding protein
MRAWHGSVRLMAKKKAGGKDTIAVNRRARFDYDINDVVEVGLVLTGTEVKSLRGGKASLAEAFATVRGDELWLVQAHIPEYEYGNRQNHDPTRQRKLLAHRDEIAEMARFTQEQGRTLVPMRLYWRDGKAKLQLGLATGKARHDKRASIAERDAQRDVDRALRTRQRE